MSATYVLGSAAAAILVLWDGSLVSLLMKGFDLLWPCLYYVGLLWTLSFMILAMVAMMNQKTITETCILIAIFVYQSFGAQARVTGVRILSSWHARSCFALLTSTCLTVFFSAIFTFPLLSLKAIVLTGFSFLANIVGVPHASSLFKMTSKEKITFQQIAHRRGTNIFQFQVFVKWKNFSVPESVTRLTIYSSTKKMYTKPEEVLKAFRSKELPFQKEEKLFPHDNSSKYKHTLLPKGTTMYVCKVEVLLRDVNLSIISTDSFALPMTLPAVLLGCEGAKIKLEQSPTKVENDRVRYSFLHLAQHLSKSVDTKIRGLNFKYLALLLASERNNSKERLAALKLLSNLATCKAIQEDLCFSNHIYQALRTIFAQYRGTMMPSEEESKMLQCIALTVMEFMNVEHCEKIWVKDFPIEEILLQKHSEKNYKLLIEIATKYSDKLDHGRLDNILSSVSIVADRYPQLVYRNPLFMELINNRITEQNANPVGVGSAAPEEVPSPADSSHKDSDGVGDRKDISSESKGVRGEAKVPVSSTNRAASGSSAEEDSK